jgi:20S proteasome alpha/beta subunit
MIGTHYSDSHVTTGFANHLARPLFRERQSDDMSEADAVKLMHDALRVCYYRDKQSMNKFQIGKVRVQGGVRVLGWRGCGCAPRLLRVAGCVSEGWRRQVQSACWRW